ncbi:hypothetical protein V1477_009601 [Vespula maculifrons]|uniref:Uncharacterized protein n=1 Tax=Vespula maculifrons TaxID=7453 RepID=A0ABD2CA80_VESMC
MERDCDYNYNCNCNCNCNSNSGNCNNSSSSNDDDDDDGIARERSQRREGGKHGKQAPTPDLRDLRDSLGDLPSNFGTHVAAAPGSAPTVAAASSPLIIIKDRNKRLREFDHDTQVLFLIRNDFIKTLKLAMQRYK